MPGSGAGSLEFRGDSDWFRVRFEAGKTYTIDGPPGVSLGLRLPDGTTFAPPVVYSNKLTFVAPVTGDYWVSATDAGSAGGFYGITATEIADLTPASLATPLSLAVGATATVGSNTAGTDDWYAVDLIAGQSYFARSDFLVATLYLIDAAGQVILQRGHQLHFTPTESGRYYLGHHNQSGSSYSLSLAAVADDRGESAASAGAFAVGTPAIGMWETGDDADWYAITLTAGESYKFSVTAANAPSMPPLRIFDAQGNLVSIGILGLAPANMIFAPDSTGTFYVSARNGTDFYNPQYNWTHTLTATQLVGDLTDNALTTGVLTIGSGVAGSIDGFGDRDWFAVSLSAGQSYQFSSSAYALALYDAAGNLLSEVAQGSAGLAKTITATGTYYLELNAGLSASGSYTLSGAAYADDLVDNNTTTGTLTVGGLAAGVTEVAGDRDWFAVQLQAGLSYVAASDAGLEMTIRDAAGNALTPVGPHFSPTASGTFYVEAHGSSLGAYSVSIVQVTDDYREDMLSTGALRQSITGTSGDDSFTSTIEHESINGSGGNDRFVAGAGYDVFNGGTGSDTIAFGEFASPINVSLRFGTVFESGVARIRLSSVENVEGSAFDDIIEGSTSANLLDGGAGNDAMNGRGGNDIYVVDSFGDTVTELANEGADTVQTALGSSTDYTALYFLPDHVENLVLTGSAQGVHGNALDNVITATGGNDLLVLSGGAPFTLSAQGTDTVNAGAGDDYIFFGGSLDATDTIDSGAGYDFVGLLGNYAGLTLGATSFAGVERLAMYSSGDAATPYSYAITTHDGNVAAGQTLAVTAATLLANEVLTFNGSAETNGKFQVTGGRGADSLTGGAGADRFIGGLGADLISGGAGNDVFQFNTAGDSTAAARDQILDFAAGDKFDLWFVDANAALGGNQKFDFIGANAFGNVAGQLRATEQSPGLWLVEGDTDGDGLADLSIQVTVVGGHLIGAGDFVL